MCFDELSRPLMEKNSTFLTLAALSLQILLHFTLTLDAEKEKSQSGRGAKKRGRPFVVVVVFNSLSFLLKMRKEFYL